MKRIVQIMFLSFGLLTLGGVTPQGGKAASARDSAVVEFADTVKLGGVLLRGKYLIVHDEERMALGEACTYVYRGEQIDEAKLVTSFHCIHVDREVSPTTKITTTHRSMPYETPEVIEIQFAGSKEGHRVP